MPPPTLNYEEPRNRSNVPGDEAGAGHRCTVKPRPGP